MSATITTRRHPKYSMWQPLWGFYTQSYIGGANYVSTNLFRYFKEGDAEFNARLQRAYRENHCKRVVDLVNSYLFKEGAVRQTENPHLKKFIENADGRGNNLTAFMKEASLWASVNGRIYVVVDKPSLDDSETTGTQADNLKALPYCYTVLPQDVLDVAFFDNGRVKWIIIREEFREDDDPFTAKDAFSVRYRLWVPGGWKLFSEKGELVDEGETGLEGVPVIYIDNEKQDAYGGQSIIADIAYLDRAIFNNWSRLDTIVCDQTFSQLIFPIEGLTADIVSDQNLREQFLTLATNRIILYSSQAQAPPSFISPDASQAQFILSMIERQVKQLYASIGLQGETAEETKAAASGVSKAYDFDKLNKLLASKADNLEQGEKQIFQFVKEWMAITGEITVEYPDEFDVKGLAEELDIAERLTALDVSKAFTKEIHKNLVAKALPKAAPEIIDEINKEIDAKAEETDEAVKGNVFPFDQGGKSQNKKEVASGKGNVENPGT